MGRSRVLVLVIILNTLSIIVSISTTHPKQPLLSTPTHIIDEERRPQEAMYPMYKIISQREKNEELIATIQLLQNSNPLNVDNIERLELRARYSQWGMRVEIIDPNKYRFQMDNDIYDENQFTNYTKMMSECPLEIEVQAEPFGFRIFDKLTKFTIFDSTLLLPQDNPDFPFYYSNEYLQLSTHRRNTTQISGFGERVSNFSLPPGTYTSWAVAQDCPIDHGKLDPRGRNMYGFHPFLLLMDTTANRSAGGMLLRIGNAIDLVVGEEYLAFKYIGGIVDLHFFAGATPLEVIRNYHRVIGRPLLPPLWALGWHQCRWGYTHIQNLTMVYNGYRDNHIPLDTIWNDIDYMLEYKDFTLNNDNYPGMAEFIHLLHSVHMHYIPIIDAGIARREYFAYNIGKEMDVFVKRKKGSEEDFVGYVWPKAATFVDFWHPNATAYWSEMLEVLSKIVDYDGLWLDMNEASSFCDGEGPPCSEFYVDPDIEPLNLAYTPGNHSIEDQLLTARASYYGGDTRIDYNLHNTWAFMEIRESNHAIRMLQGKRPMIISRSTLYGQGQYSGHWLGDNYSRWEQLRYSIPGTMNFQIFGIPLVGADICGFHNNTTPELCIRWHQLGAFYGFARNHNDLGWLPQEPFNLGMPALRMCRSAIRLRYSLLLYLYSNFYSTHLHGGSLFSPLYFSFPNEDITINPKFFGIEDQFMFGEGIMVAPVVHEGAVNRSAYIPSGVFYDFFTGDSYPGGRYITAEAPLAPGGHPPVYIRGGYIIPHQSISDNIHTTEDLRYNLPIDLYIALDPQTAEGEIYLDDGISVESAANSLYDQYRFTAFRDIYIRETLHLNLSQVVANWNNKKEGEFGVLGSVLVFSSHLDPLSTLNIPGFGVYALLSHGRMWVAKVDIPFHLIPHGGDNINLKFNL